MSGKKKILIMTMKRSGVEINADKLITRSCVEIRMQNEIAL